MEWIGQLPTGTTNLLIVLGITLIGLLQAVMNHAKVNRMASATNGTLTEIKTTVRRELGYTMPETGEWREGNISKRIKAIEDNCPRCNEDNK